MRRSASLWLWWLTFSAYSFSPCGGSFVARPGSSTRTTRIGRGLLTREQQQQQQHLRPVPISQMTSRRNKLTTTTSTLAAIRDEEETSSDSFGSLLVRMKNNEEALLAQQSNLTATLEDVEELDPIHKVTQRKEKRKPFSSTTGSKTDSSRRPTETREIGGTTASTTSRRSKTNEQIIPGMTWETAKELDDSVTSTRSSGSPEDLLRNVQVLPLSSLYASRQQQRTDVSTTSTLERATSDRSMMLTTTLLPLSRPEHYRDRIGRDRRHLAVSIAATTETEAQWRLFCQEQGGLYPLLETIREGARVLRRHTKKTTTANKRSSESTTSSMEQTRSTTTSSTLWLDHHDEESVRVACRACQAGRDLCAISPELAAVLTDGILRANAAWAGGLMEDFCVILSTSTSSTSSSESTSATAPDSGSTATTNTNRAQRSLVQRFRERKEIRLRCKLFVTQLLLAMVVASDDAVQVIRSTPGLADAVLACSSYAGMEQARRWLRYPREFVKWLWRRAREKDHRRGRLHRRPFMEAANLGSDLNGQLQRSANQILAAIGYNKWIPKNPGQRGLRILTLDGGGSRGMASITAVNQLMEQVGNGADVADSFDMIVGTSTGGIIAFLVGLQRETSAQALERYKSLIKQIFVKSALSTPMMLFTTASYDEVHFMEILVRILKENSMLDSRAEASIPLVCAVTSKMSSTPTHVALFRNYNYPTGEMPDPFTIDPDKAREDLELSLDLEHEMIRTAQYQRRKTTVAKTPGSRSGGGSRHPGSFRVLQRYALRASTAAPTFFKPVMMAGEMYCDGGIVASNPTAVAIHEARTLFPNIPIELVVSVGTGAFIEQKSAPRVGWDGILGQIVNSATDGEQIHHILEDLLGEQAVLGRKKSAVARTRYFRFNPVIGKPDEFPIDVTDPDKLKKLQTITVDYMAQPDQQEKIKQIADILKGR